MSKTDKELTRKNLLEAAKKEFMAVGYEKASLRKICADADMTTGALYFFFKDKRDIFLTIVSEPIAKIQQNLYAHYEQEARNQVDEEDDLEVSFALMRLLYTYRDDYMLLVNNQEFLTPILDEIIEKTQVHYSMMFEQISNGKKADTYLMHWVAHVQTEAFVNLFAHVENVDEAIEKIPEIVSFLRGGFYEMIKNA